MNAPAGNRTRVSCATGRCLSHWTTEAQIILLNLIFKTCYAKYHEKIYKIKNLKKHMTKKRIDYHSMNYLPIKFKEYLSSTSTYKLMLIANNELIPVITKQNEKGLLRFIRENKIPESQLIYSFPNGENELNRYKVVRDKVVEIRPIYIGNPIKKLFKNLNAPIQSYLKEVYRTLKIRAYHY